ncbi:MAG: NAD(P)H-hydrate dehydratase [Candidatus Diapherotrites archaeon]|uniref:ADP-dependent (S)-NAD(P)H-hydrate dehydratase n=1 Tax=Candidatus Iainarchaeum sp. TaxID=3101447 RepID=A0A2D6M158_9ARCH|nr:NAD(P)H-hydrate dehydratase [Candidatus Diapherotrites archaeon]|tara:strand:+ start:3465 stop:4268 length:804 start_codon:yes stop_codon:yes gene_type:complete
MVSLNSIKITGSIFKKIQNLAKKSHKYENGVVLVVAGSSLYHGSLVFAAVTASRIADLIHVCTARENFSVIKKCSPALIVHSYGTARKLAEEVDSILIGPGIPETRAMKNLVTSLVSGNPDKKIILDATALHLIPASKLHSNCVVTPHAREFKALFDMPASKENVVKAAKKFGCIVTLKGQIDYISDGEKIYSNSTGNEGLTKGGTGDTLAGLIVGFASQNPLLESTLAAFYLNGFAGDRLKKKLGTMFNAKDLMAELPLAFKKIKK